MHAIDDTSVLDLNQLREVTLNDEELIREILDSLVNDTDRQLVLLDQAIRDHDAQRIMRLAHYSKGACANIGANVLAALLKRLELQAAAGRIDECAVCFQAFSREIERFRIEAASV